MIKGTKVKLRKKQFKDAESDYRWQCDPELAELDAVPPMRMEFMDYAEEYKDILRHPADHRMAFAILTLDGKHIGNCVYYNIDRNARQAEIGIMIGDRDFWNKGYGSDAVIALVNHVFHRTNFIRLYLKTLEKNLRAQNSFRKCGFTPYGNLERDGYRFMLMELPRWRWQGLKATPVTTALTTPPQTHAQPQPL